MSVTHLRGLESLGRFSAIFQKGAKVLLTDLSPLTVSVS